MARTVKYTIADIGVAAFFCVLYAATPSFLAHQTCMRCWTLLVSESLRVNQRNENEILVAPYITVPKVERTSNTGVG